MHEEGEQPEKDETADEYPGDALDHVPQTEMTELMCQHRLHFTGRETREQGIEEDDALGAAEPGEIGIAVAAAARPVHHHESLHLEAAAGEQRFDALPKL